jgi:hypothetical protein
MDEYIMSLSSQFFTLFKGLDRAHGVFIIKQKNLHKNKIEGKAATNTTPPTIDLWEKHLNGEQGLGIIPITDDATCSWGAIDIDQYSDFDILALEKHTLDLKLPLIVCRTKSGGAHLYLFLKKPAEASLIRSKLMEWSIALGHPNVEVFPKQIRLASREDVGNWLNMPYFNAAKTTRFAYKNGVPLTAQEFIHYANELAVTEDVLRKITLFTDDELAQAPPCLQHLCNKSFPEGTRNKGLFNICIFVKQKYGDDWKQKVDEYNLKFINPPLSSFEVQQVIKSASRKAYFYTCKEQPISSVCNKAICLTRKYGVGNAADDLGVILNGLTKIETVPPSWILAVNGIRIQIDGTESLLSQAAFRNLCVERLNILPNRIKQDVWERTVKELLDRVDIVEAPQDASPVGQLLYLIEEFCLTRAQARDRSELLIGRPFKDLGFTHFRSTDLIKYLHQRKFKEIDTPAKIWNVIREHGGENRVFSINGKSHRVWAIPSPEEITEDFTVPPVKEKEEF